MNEYSERLSHLDSCAVSDAWDKLGLTGDVIGVEQGTGIDSAPWDGGLTIGVQMRGMAGAIVEGCARDIEESRQLGFPVFARAITGRAARTRIMLVATGEPNTAGEVTVTPGDYVIADASSVVFVKPGDIARVLETAEAILSRESGMAQALREGKPISQVMTGNYESATKA
jgi:4-hydroxy-4-methyl-2-oxoglutarate aldolase